MLSTLYQIIKAVVLFVVSLPFAIADDVSGVNTTPEAWTARQQGNCAIIMALLLLGIIVLIGVASFTGGNADLWNTLNALYKGSVGG